MSDILVTSPYRPFTLPNQFKAVFNGYIYCGTVDAVDPSVSQVQVYLANEDGSRTPVAQPLRTNAGGFLVYNGQPAKFVTDSNHSLLVRDSLGNQVWYAPDMASVDPDTIFSVIRDTTATVFKNEYGNSAVDNMIAGRVKGIAGAVVHRVGNIYSTGGTTWECLVDGAAVIADFKPLTAINVKDLGAKGDGVADDSDAIKLAEQNDGTVFYPPGVYRISRPIVVKSNTYHVGSGVGSTIIMPLDGTNTDVFKSENFDSLTGVGPLASAPKNFGIRDLQIDGNYLDDWRGASIGGDTTVNNTQGYGVKLFGSKYKIDVEINNCAQVGFYSEAVDYTGYGDEQECYIRLTGRVFGKEAAIYRGPADVFIDEIMMGAVGWLPTLAERRSTIVVSDIYPTREVAVMVSDEQSVGSDSYHGHHEFGFMHLYGNLSGYGYRTENTGRVKGDHMICENCRGGAEFGARVWGGVSMLECHNNGRKPADYVGQLDVLPDIRNLSQQGFTINGVTRRVKVESSIYTAYTDASEDESIKGGSSIVTLNYFSLNDPDTSAPPVGNVADIKGRNQQFTLNCRDVTGDAINHQGISNNIKVTARNVSGNVVNRVAGPTSGNHTNSFDINGDNVGNCFRVSGVVTPEQVKIIANLQAGQTVINGDSPDFLNRATTWDVAARVNGVSKSSNRKGRVNLDNTVTTERTVTVSHGFFTTPDPAMVSFNLYDPSPTFSGTMAYLYLQAVTDSELTFVYKLGATGAGGPLVLLWGVDS